MLAASTMFYVNVWPETFCLAAAMAEAFGMRVLALCLGDVGALSETVMGPQSLVTKSVEEFRGAFEKSLAMPVDCAAQSAGSKEFTPEVVMPGWLEILESPDAKLKSPIGLSSFVFRLSREKGQMTNDAESRKPKAESPLPAQSPKPKALPPAPSSCPRPSRTASGARSETR
jgi:hypothetical protein